MKKLPAGLALFTLLLPPLLAGCESLSPVTKYLPFGHDDGKLSGAPPGAIEYRCEDDKSFYLRTMEGDKAVWLIYPEREVRLDRTNAARGTSYSNGSAELNFNSGIATLVDGSRNYKGCAVPARK